MGDVGERGTADRWLVLIHRLPAKAAYSRIKVWRAALGTQGQRVNRPPKYAGLYVPLRTHNSKLPLRDERTAPTFRSNKDVATSW
jgi:hypothetical protein